MKYLKTIRSVRIIYNREKKRGKDFIIKRYLNFDWTSDHNIKKLTFGFVFMLNRDFIS